MKIQLRPVTLANRGDLDDIDPGEPERYLVHANWYWHQQSLENPDVTFRLIHLKDHESAVGMVAYGPFYNDRGLTQRADGSYEVIHLVIDRRWRRSGIGTRVVASVVRILRALPDCQRVVVATHPDNEVSKGFFQSMGFQPVDKKNYDGDPIMIYEVTKGSPPQRREAPPYPD
jgi:RimJ/RimL family protein N-acetyltransferase